MIEQMDRWIIFLWYSEPFNVKTGYIILKFSYLSSNFQNVVDSLSSCKRDGFLY